MGNSPKSMEYTLKTILNLHSLLEYMLKGQKDDGPWSNLIVTFATSQAPFLIGQRQRGLRVTGGGAQKDSSGSPQTLSWKSKAIPPQSWRDPFPLYLLLAQIMNKSLSLWSKTQLTTGMG